MHNIKLISGTTVTALLLTACGNSNTSNNQDTGLGDGTRPTVEIVNIAYFEKWPTPNLVAKAEGKYDEALGVTTNWVNFQTGTDMTAAMLAGNIDIAYSQGMPPFVTGINAGTPIQTIAVATIYPAPPCIVRNESGINATNAADLAGRAVAVPLGTSAEYSFRRQMTSLGVDQSDLTIVDQLSADAANSLLNGTVDMACLFGSQSIDNALLGGTRLLTIAQMSTRGITGLDVVSATDELINNNPQLVTSFLTVTDDYNQKFQNTQPELDLIVNESGLDEAAVRDQMNDLEFPAAATQLSDYLNNGGLVSRAFEVAGDVFATEQSPGLTDYSAFINSSFLR